MILPTQLVSDTVAPGPLECSTLDKDLKAGGLGGGEGGPQEDRDPEEGKLIQMFFIYCQIISHPQVMA